MKNEHNKAMDTLDVLFRLAFLGIVISASVKFICKVREARSQAERAEILANNEFKNTPALTAVGVNAEGKLLFDKNQDGNPDYAANMDGNAIISTNTIGVTKSGIEWLSILKKDTMSKLSEK